MLNFCSSSGFRPLPRNGRSSTMAGFIMVLLLPSTLWQEIGISPKIPISGRRSTSTSSDPFKPSPRPTEHPNVFAKSHWCSRAPPTPVKATELAGVEVAATAPPLLHRRRPPSLLRPPNRHHSTRGELLVLSPTSPTSSHRRLAGATTPASPRAPYRPKNSVVVIAGLFETHRFFVAPDPTCLPGRQEGPGPFHSPHAYQALRGLGETEFSDQLSVMPLLSLTGVLTEAAPLIHDPHKGALADGTYNLVPVNEEEVPEGGADVVVIDQEPDSVLAQEGKPQSTT
nr:unnamed protein product [Digitaria exilis]